MLSDLLIEPDSLVAVPGGLRLGLRLPWYQSLPLSVIRLVELSVDAVPVCLEKVYFTLNGLTRPLTDLPELTGEFWFVTDTLQVEMPFDGAHPDTEHVCAVRMTFFPPYAETLRRDNAGQMRMRAS